MSDGLGDPVAVARAQNPQMVQCTIVLAGELGGRFSDALDGMSLRAEDGRTTLVGELTDQAQVQGVLHQLFDLGLEVLSFSTTPDGSPG